MTTMRPQTENTLPKPKILVVDDTPANLVAMRRLLSKTDAELIEASSGNKALAACLDHEFALILLDVNMPDMDGFEVAALLSEEVQTRDTPIIFVTAAADELNRLRGYSFGAVDYIAKPINDAVLLSKVRVFLDLYRSRRQLQLLLDELNQRNQQLEIEIVERKRIEEIVRHQAGHDALTGLPNRSLFMDRLQQSLQRSQRSQTSCALLYIDIDGFKQVNDHHGHPAGDQLLQSIAQRLLAQLRKSDTVARLGGDEFAVVVDDIQSSADVEQLATSLCATLRVTYELLSDDVPVIAEIGASIGIALFPQHASGADLREAMIQAADRAMYQAKRSGKNRSVLAS